MSYDSKNSQAKGRQLKSQRLVIPFTITASATPSAVVLGCDEPGLMFLKTEGKDQITGALEVGETATYSVSPNDANGIMNIFIKLSPDESCSKVLRAQVTSRTTGVQQPVKLGDADGVSSLGNIMLTLDSSVDHSTTNVDASLEVEYIAD